MKIAVASKGNTIWGHFGHCENFNIFDIKDGEIQSVENVPNPGHRPGFLPNFLADMGVKVIIAGGMAAAPSISLISATSKSLSAQRAMPKLRLRRICGVS